MTITDKVTTAIKAVIDNEASLVNECVVGVASDINTEFTARVVVIGQSSSLRHTFVPGCYDVTGMIAIQHSIDLATPVATFRSICDEIRLLFERKRDLPTILNAAVTGLKVHSFNLEEQAAEPSKRALQAFFQWQVFAELPR